MSHHDRINPPNDTAESLGESVEPKLKRKEYEKVLRELQTELCSVQDWVKRTGERIIVLFEGRDAAGKGGTIRAMTERVSPRTFRIAALGAVRPGKIADVYTALFRALSGGRRNRDLRP